MTKMKVDISVTLEAERVVVSPNVTHLRFRVVD